jgi:hypothetical protein
MQRTVRRHWAVLQCNAMQCHRRRAKQTSAVPCGPDVSSTNARCVRHARCTHTECVMQAACCVLHIVRAGEAERSGVEWSGRDKYHSKYVAPEFELSESVLEHSRLTAAHSAVDYVTALHCVLYCCIFIMCVACWTAALRHHSFRAVCQHSCGAKPHLCLNSSARGPWGANGWAATRRRKTGPGDRSE